MNFYFLFFTLFGVYIAAWGFCCLSCFYDRFDKLNLWGERFLALGGVIHILFVALIFFKLENFLFESFSGLLILLSLLLNFSYFIVKAYFPKRILSVALPPFVIFFLVISVHTSSDFPVFQRFLEKSSTLGKLLLYFHVFCSIFGYLLFGVACLSSILFLLQEKRIKNKTLSLKKAKSPSLGFLDLLNYKVIIAGLAFLTAGLFLGINMKIIANEGRFDISIRQALNVFTWGLYVFFVIDRIINGLRGKTTAMWAIAGFCASTASLAYELYLLASR